VNNKAKMITDSQMDKRFLRMG